MVSVKIELFAGIVSFSIGSMLGWAMLYGEILHFVEEWIILLGVLLSALAGTILTW